MKRGFTLIELLVVIAIIGILASIVLVSFPGAQKKARDSRVVGAISQARTVMTYINANDGNYDAFTETHDDMVNLWAEIVKNDNDDAAALAPAIVRDAASGSSEACIYAQLSAKDDWYYCASSDGRAGFTSTPPNGATYCVADTSAECPPLDE